MDKKVKILEVYQKFLTTLRVQRLYKGTNGRDLFLRENNSGRDNLFFSCLILFPDKSL